MKTMTELVRSLALAALAAGLTGAAASRLQAAPRPFPSPDKAAAAAFRQAYGRAAPVSVQADGHAMRAAPYALITLAPGREALIVKETNGFDSHGAEAAATVIYFSGAPGGSKVTGRFEHIAWAGENGGRDASFQIRRDLGTDPIVLMRGQTTFQGERRDDTAIIRLGPDKPLALGWINLLEDNQDDVSDHLISYRGEIIPAAAPAVLAVRYRGWTAASEKAPHKPFNLIVPFTVRDGCIVPVQAVKLPDSELSARLGPDCKAG